MIDYACVVVLRVILNQVLKFVKSFETTSLKHASIQEGKKEKDEFDKPGVVYCGTYLLHLLLFQ